MNRRTFLRLRRLAPTATGIYMLTVLAGCATEKVVIPPPVTPKEEAPDPTFGAEAKEARPDRPSKSDEDTPQPAVAVKAAAEEPYHALPECRPQGDSCFPPRAFTQRLCRASYPGVSIKMFEKDAGWARGYIRVEQVEPVNTFGGPASDTKLTFGEEVVILQKSGGAGEVQVSGGGFVVLRWDGTCATLADHELVTWVPGVPRHAPFVWNYIDDNIQQALLSNQRIERARRTQRKSCPGGRLSKKSPACEKATSHLNETVVLAVRTGIALPTPENLP